MAERIEYAVRWAEPVAGLRDVSTPRAHRQFAEEDLINSAFDGTIVTRTVTESDWTPAATQPAVPAVEVAHE